MHCEVSAFFGRLVIVSGDTGHYKRQGVIESFPVGSTGSSDAAIQVDSACPGINA